MPAREAKDSSSAEAARVAQDAARRYLDELARTSNTYLAAWTATRLAGLRAAFELQGAMVQASRIMLDATTQANREWMDQTAEWVRQGQEITAKLVTTGVDMTESTLPGTHR